MKESIGLINFACSVICAKWALDLGHSQIRQVIWWAGGMIFGPFTMLFLYIKLITKAKSDNKSSGDLL